MLQKIYDCTLILWAPHLQGAPLPINTRPLSGVTRDEIKLLASIHGADRITNIVARGEGEVMMLVPNEHGKTVLVPVKSQMDEYKRLAAKYDTKAAVNEAQTGRFRVEKCFNVKLDDFDDLMETLDAAETLEAQLNAAEAKAAAQGASTDEVVGLPADASGEEADLPVEKTETKTTSMFSGMFDKSQTANQPK
jgi:hypothetical protein